jgi:hypothetical protein
MVHNGSSTSLSSIASVSSASSNASSVGGSNGHTPFAFSPTTLEATTSMSMHDKSDGSNSPTSDQSLLSSYSSSSSVATASSANSSQSTSSYGSLPGMVSGHFSSAMNATPSYLGVPSSHVSTLGGSYHQNMAVVSSSSPSSSMASSGSQTNGLAGLPQASNTMTPAVSSNGATTGLPTPCAAKKEYEVGPILVHCSAGIGRSGAFILIHSVLEKLKLEGKMQNDINLSALLEEMRKCRVGLVPHQMQYNFCYNAIDYCLCYKNMQRSFGLPEPNRARMRQAALQKSSLNRSSHVIPNFGSESAFF